MHVEQPVKARTQWVHPRAHWQFMIALAISVVITGVGLGCALLFAGGFWWSFIIGLGSTILIYGASEISGANDEVLIPNDPEDDS